MLNHLLEINQQEIISNYINNIEEKIENIIIWGSTTSSRYIEFLKEYNLEGKIIFLADNNKKIQGKFINGFKVLNPIEVLNIVKKNSNTLIVLSSIHCFEIKRQLLHLGISSKNIDVLGSAISYEYKNNNMKIFKDNLKDFSNVQEILEDEVSKNIYSEVLESRITFNNSLLVKNHSTPSNQYFEKDLIEIDENDIFCDCGSYIGDTLDIFISKYNKYKNYIAIEADPSNYKQLIENISEKNYKNIITQNIGCWDKKDKLSFSSDSTSGKINEFGTTEINVDKLDNILKNTPITFLKMDIEGAEENALLGAKEIIQRDKPILAICLYHSLEDFYKLPLLIKEMNPDYHLFVRHYTPMFNTETVCYAIPTNRLIKK